MSELRLAFALHDVTPFHRERIDRAEAYFAEWGICKAAYLLIPDYHGLHSAATAEFSAWCRRARPWSVEWFLHGYYHQECTASTGPLDVHDPDRSAFQSGEAEFAVLDEATAAQRLTHGRRVFETCLGHAPRGFTAPKWAFRPTLPSQLAAQRFEWTEDYHAIFHLPTGRRFRSPAVTWATRTWLRKATSLVGVPLLRRLWSRAPLLRIAVHPFDFDHPATIRSIERTVRAAVRTRRQIGYDELLE